MKHIKVFAPGTVANLGCGFDIMGLTLDGVGDRIEVAAEAGASGLAIRNESGKRLPEKPEDNVITPAVAAMLEAYGKPVQVEITILEKIAPGSGIGSSAASSAAAVYGLNELLGRPFAAERLVEFAMMGEALIGGTPHADNVGPALLGGVVLIRGYGPLDIIRLPVPDDFFYAVAHPDIVVGTKEAREVLPREIPMAHAVTQWGNVGGLVAGLALGDVALIGGTPHADNVGPAVLGGVVLIRGYEPFDIVRLPVPDNFFYAVAHPAIVVSTKDAREVLPREIPLSKAVEQWGNVGGLVAGFALRDVALIGRSMHDAVAEPYRKGFIPGYDELKELVLAEGALAMNIAGSGPSVFALASDYGVAQRIAAQMERHFQLRQIGCHTYAGRVSNAGARVVEQ